jgi:tetratricopeptide (TPR) repeat protein
MPERYASLVRWLPLFLASAALALAPGPAPAQDLSDEDLGSWARYVLELEARVSRSDDPRLLLRLVDAYVQMGDLRRATDGIERLEGMGVDPVRIGLLRGDSFFRLRRWDDAVAAYLGVLAVAPDQPYALNRLWRTMLEVTLAQTGVSFDRGAVVERLQAEGLYFPEVYEPEPDGPDQAARLVTRASTLLPDRPEEAVALLIQAIALDPGNAAAFHALGRAYDASDEPELAVGAFLVCDLLAPDTQIGREARRAVGRHIERASAR